MKKVDANEFYRQASLRICGSLDISKAMSSLLDYLKDFIPVSELTLSHFSSDLVVVENLVTITTTGKIRVVPPIVASPEIMPLVKSKMEEWQQSPGHVQIINDSSQDLRLQPFKSFYETPDPSAMMMLLEMENIIIGSVVILAPGKGAFTESHARLFWLLREPFAIAMSNALRYAEVVKLKDMVAADYRELNKELFSIATNEIVGSDYGLAGVMEMIRQVAPLGTPVMLFGETGVGKEIIANAIYSLSPRRDAPFIKVNCGAIPDTLLDAELFGHEKGAFTGAIAQKRGRFERAHQGTIFLDEVAELPPQAQVRLLRVLQQKEIERVGGTQTIPVDVRVICATNKNLENMVRSGAFREDLWFRLNVFPIIIPPLRQRVVDIPALVHHFVAKKSRELKIHPHPAISATGVEKLKEYSWPGNVRELENLTERELIRNCGPAGSASPVFSHFGVSERPATEQSLFEPGSTDLAIDKAMSSLIREALSRANGKIYGPGGAAQLLDINPSTLRSRMKKLGIKKR